MDDQDENAHILCAVVTIPFASRCSVRGPRRRPELPDQRPAFTIIGTFKESVDDMGESEITDNTILIPYSVGATHRHDNVKQIYFSLRR